MNTSTGLTLADGIGFITNVFWSFSFWNTYAWSQKNVCDKVLKIKI